MRKLDKAIIWPIYFDLNKSRQEGRRIPKSQAVQSPKIAEIKEAADKLGLQNQLNIDAHFPKMPWAKTGMLLVEKNEAKEAIIKKLAKQLVKIKSQQVQQQTNVKKHWKKQFLGFFFTYEDSVDYAVAAWSTCNFG